MATFSKLQIRAKILSVLANVKSIDEYNEKLLLKLINDLNDIEDRKALFDVFIKEFIKLEEKECDFCSCIIKKLVPNDYVQEVVLSFLASPKYDDEIKYKLVQLLRTVGGNPNEEGNVSEYFDNPQEVLDKETQMLLDKAIYNPESMLDFLDFVYSIQKQDRFLLLESLKDACNGEQLINSLYPILYSDFDDDFKLEIVNLFGDSKSSLTLEPINYLLKITENKEIEEACKLALKKLKLSGATEQKAIDFYKKVLELSLPAKFYTTIPDGAGNQAVLITRINENTKYSMVAVVINDYTGIIDTFGFYDITQEEVVRIIAKFYSSEGKYQISPEYAKTRLDFALNLSIKNKQTLPYEFVCWNVLMKDIPALGELPEKTVQDYELEKNYTKDEICSVLTNDYTMRWFMNKTDNAQFCSYLNELITLENPDIKIINDLFYSYLDKIWDKETLQKWKDRLIQLVYLLKINNTNNEDFDKFLFITKNNEAFDLFKKILIQRSVVSNLVMIIENEKEKSFTTNIFKRKTKSDDKIDIKRIENLLEVIKRNWIDG